MKPLFVSLRIDHERVLSALREAERGTSGEIRVLISRSKALDPVAAAQSQFDRLGLAKAPERNGVLIFVSPRSRRFAIVGDTAVHRLCGDSFWAEVASAMSGYFKQGDFTGGLVHGIERAGSLLAEKFPRSAGGGSSRKTD